MSGIPWDRWRSVEVCIVGGMGGNHLGLRNERVIRTPSRHGALKSDAILEAPLIDEMVGMVRKEGWRSFVERKVEWVENV